MSLPFPDEALKTVTQIDNLAKRCLLKPNPRLENATAHSDKQGLRRVAIPPLNGQFLGIQAKLIGAKKVLEVGGLGGVSAIHFAEAGASVTSIEVNPKHRDVALENVKGLDVEILLGKGLDVLPNLADEGRVFDMVFIDADWENQAAYFDWAVKLTRQGGCIFVDNVVRELIDSDLLDPSKESLVTKVGRDERVQATLIPMMSSYKGVNHELLDGFLFARVK